MQEVNSIFEATKTIIKRKISGKDVTLIRKKKNQLIKIKFYHRSLELLVA